MVNNKFRSLNMRKKSSKKKTSPILLGDKFRFRAEGIKKGTKELSIKWVYRDKDSCIKASFKPFSFSVRFLKQIFRFCMQHFIIKLLLIVSRNELKCSLCAIDCTRFSRLLET